MNHWRSSVAVCAICVGISSTYSNAQSLGQWAANQKTISTDFMMANISRPDAAKGSVVASPSRSSPDYYYHWIRDAALVMDQVVELYRTSSGSQRQIYLQTLFDYVDFSRKNQLTNNPSGGLGEPKFLVSGEAYNGPWMRPQNDGPALRAITLIHFANVMIAEGHKDYVRQKLYDGSLPTNSVVKADLEYVSHNMSQPCFDLWEETFGYHFYTRMVQRRALIEGANLADALDDPQAALWYHQAAAKLGEDIATHWDYSRNIILASLGVQNATKTSGLDSSVVLAVLHGETEDGFYSPNHEQVLATAVRLEDSFRQLYPINQGSTESLVIGRYPEDMYSGYGAGEGNGWVLLENAFAEFYYKAAGEFETKKYLKVTDVNQVFFASLGVLTGGDLAVGKIHNSGSGPFAAIIEKMKSIGDSYLAQTWRHENPDGSLSEQINRYSGYMQGAPNLTWSHASFIAAVNARK